MIASRPRAHRQRPSHTQPALTPVPLVLDRCQAPSSQSRPPRARTLTLRTMSRPWLRSPSRRLPPCAPVRPCESKPRTAEGSSGELTDPVPPARPVSRSLLVQCPPTSDVWLVRVNDGGQAQVGRRPPAGDRARKLIRQRHPGRARTHHPRTHKDRTEPVESDLAADSRTKSSVTVTARQEGKGQSTGLPPSRAACLA